MQGMHHLHTRKRDARDRNWKRQLDKLMYVVAVAAPFSYAPQVYKIYTEQSTEGLALSSFALLFFINALWLVYGWAHRSMPLILTSIIFCAFHVLIATGILLYQ